MFESCSVVAQWGARQGSAEECGRRIASMLQALACVDESLQPWFLKGYSLKSALRRELPAEAGTIGALLLREKARDDRRYGGEQLEGLGYSLGMWNGGRGNAAAGMTIRCGAYATMSAVPNSCEVQLPQCDTILDRLLATEGIVRTLQILVDAWEPDRAFVLVHSEHGDRELALVKSVLYLPVSPERLPDLPPPAYAVPSGSGSVLFVTPERFRYGEPAHREAAVRLSALLPHARILEIEKLGTWM